MIPSYYCIFIMNHELFPKAQLIHDIAAIILCFIVFALKQNFLHTFQRYFPRMPNYQGARLGCNWRQVRFMSMKIMNFSIIIFSMNNGNPFSFIGTGHRHLPAGKYYLQSDSVLNQVPFAHKTNALSTELNPPLTLNDVLFLMTNITSSIKKLKKVRP